MKSELLSVEDLHVYFPVYRSILSSILGRPDALVRAVDGVDLTLRRGEWLSIVGESGSGKTTLGRAIAGLQRPTSGRIYFDGIEISGLGRAEWRKLGLRRKIQMIFQDPLESLDPRMPVGELIREALEYNGVAQGAEARRRAIEALESVGLVPGEDFYRRRPRQLSGGQRQRVAVARALSLEPDLIVADEPVSMVDVSIRAAILDLLDSARRRGAAVILITHDIGIARAYSDRIAVMYLGRIVEEGPADEVVEDPRHPYTAALATSSPSLSAKRPPRWPIKGEVPDAINVPLGCRFHPRCPLARERCVESEPSLEGQGNERRYRCYYPLPRGGVWRPPRGG